VKPSASLPILGAASLLCAALLPAPASAFCGTFVGAPGASLTNHSSEVVLARSGTRTTLTLAADYAGDQADFALLLPIPEVVGPEDVTVGDASLIQWLEAYSTPRAVAYTCDDVFDLQQSGIGCGTTLGCSDAGMSVNGFGVTPGAPAADSVTVEAAFTTAGYDLVVLSAEESGDLFGWLRTNGYEVPRGGDAILQEYIDAGVYFLAARVSLDAAPTGNAWLPPLQISYDSDSFGLPIRIGTISADAEQEVLIYALTDPDTDGEVSISNYPEVTLDSECMWQDGEDRSMTDWYAGEVSAAVAEVGAGWVKEYSADLVPTTSGGYHCDPCTADPVIPGGTFAPLGFDSDGAHLTRLRMRYDPTSATEDLSLYVTGITGQSTQLRYIGYKRELEFLYPICDAGWVDEPGECPDDPVAGCSVPTLRVSGLGVLAALALLRRRRS
jgi:hypothetical protein